MAIFYTDTASIELLTVTNLTATTSSILYITQSQLNVENNLITVNTNTPQVRFGGFAVIDSGSTGLSGSLLFDSQNNQWIYVHQSAPAAAITSSVLIMGPQTFNNVGNETTITTNRLTKGSSGDLGEHITSSNVTDTGTLVSINSNTEVTGSLIVTSRLTVNSTASFTKDIQFSGSFLHEAWDGIADSAYYKTYNDDGGSRTLTETFGHISILANFSNNPIQLYTLPAAGNNQAVFTFINGATYDPTQDYITIQTTGGQTIYNNGVSLGTSFNLYGQEQITIYSRGFGNYSGPSTGWTSIGSNKGRFSGSFVGNGNITGSLLGTASFATTASYYKSNGNIFAFTGSGAGTYTPTSGMKFIKVIVTGGGGAGGQCNNTDTATGGGAAGGTAIRKYSAAEIGASQPYFVGAGGSGTTSPGGSGTASSFGGVGSATAISGSGGGGSTQLAGATTFAFAFGSITPGVGTGGELNISGGMANFGIRFDGTSGAGGAGGASFWGGGGASSAIDTAGNPGTAWGSGGSGAHAATATDRNGGNGANGIVYIEEYF